MNKTEVMRLNTFPLKEYQFLKQFSKYEVIGLQLVFSWGSLEVRVGGRRPNWLQVVISPAFTRSHTFPFR